MVGQIVECKPLSRKFKSIKLVTVQIGKNKYVKIKQLFNSVTREELMKDKIVVVNGIIPKNFHI